MKVAPSEGMRSAAEETSRFAPMSAPGARRVVTSTPSRARLGGFDAEAFSSTPLRILRRVPPPPQEDPSQEARVGMLLAESAAAAPSARLRVGHGGKEYHFFLSHKKRHSRDGPVHAQIATYLADVLRHLSFTPFLDIDQLEEISPRALREHLSRSCALVVLLHEETHTSDWCKLEWRIAEELNLPVCVVIDMERANKSRELLRAIRFPSFLRYPWVEYSDVRRRDAVDEISQFLTTHTIAAHASADDDNDGEPTPAERFYYPKIHYLMLWGGFDFSFHHSPARLHYVWFTFVRFSTYLCFFVCLARLLYSTGPAFTDHYSAIATFVLHFHLIYAPLQIRKILASHVVRGLLADVFRAADLGEIHSMSRTLFRIGAALVPLFLLMYIICWEPLFFSNLYIGEDRPALARAFGYSSGVLFLNGIFTQIPLLVCVHIMSCLIKLMACIPCESAADRLHPRIAAIGLSRYVMMHRRNFSFTVDSPAPSSKHSIDSEPSERISPLKPAPGSAPMSMPTISMPSISSGMPLFLTSDTPKSPISPSPCASDRDRGLSEQLSAPAFSSESDRGAIKPSAGAHAPLLVSEEALCRFQEHWQMGCAVCEELNAALWPMQNVQLLWAVSCALMPLLLALLSGTDTSWAVENAGGGHLFYLNSLRLVWVWLQGVGMLLAELAVDAWVTWRLRRTTRQMSELVFAKQHAYSFVKQVSVQWNPFRFSSMRIPITPVVFAAALVLVLLSAVPFRFVRWSHIS
ncbi:hypothetical protein AB1Y20_010364 [Prymnesium parvum]